MLPLPLLLLLLVSHRSSSRGPFGTIHLRLRETSASTKARLLRFSEKRTSTGSLAGAASKRVSSLRTVRLHCLHALTMQGLLSFVLVFADVERIQAEAPAQPAAPRAVPPPPPQQHHMPPTSMSISHGAPPPPMYGAEKGGYYQPPPAPPQQHFYNPPPQPPMSSYAPPPPPMIAQVEPQKEGRFGGFGKTSE